MKRGTVVKINENCSLKHCVGQIGIVIGRNKKGLYLVLARWGNFYSDVRYSEEELDIISTPNYDLNPGDEVEFKSPNKGKSLKSSIKESQ